MTVWFAVPDWPESQSETASEFPKSKNSIIKKVAPELKPAKQNTKSQQRLNGNNTTVDKKKSAKQLRENIQKPSKSSNESKVPQKHKLTDRKKSISAKANPPKKYVEKQHSGKFVLAARTKSPETKQNKRKSTMDNINAVPAKKSKFDTANKSTRISATIQKYDMPDSIPFEKAKVTKALKNRQAKTAKKLELADEESDSELAAEVNSFRKKLLAGFTGAKEIGGNGRLNANATFSDDDENDVGLSDSEGEAGSKQKHAPKNDAFGEKNAKEPAKGREAKSKSEVAVVGKEDAVAPSASASTGNAFRDKLIDNLKGSRFRYLNEQLYSSDGTSAVKLFNQDRAAFTAYHDGYRQQVTQWPLNPLDRIIKSIRKLPKTKVIADFGCGEGALAKAIPNKTYSLDLVAQRHEIIACDMAKTPLETGSIDVAVYCLSLMGTNLRDFIFEANRVLKIGGQLKIAEVESRFDDVRTFVEHIKACGFQHINTDTSSKFFVFLNFSKARTLDAKLAAKQVQPFSLKPCLYKKR